MRTSRAISLPLLLLGACATSPPEPAALGLRTWGGMKEVLRLERTEGRVTLAEVLTPVSSGVGLLEGLAAEITIDRGVVHLASVEDGELATRELAPGDRATLLVLADVPEWTSFELPPLADLAALERALPALAERAGLDPAEPLPLRIEGRFAALDLHVLDRSCPIANPDGPPPWELIGAEAEGVLVGVHALDAGGVLTHHGDTLHLHALVTTADGRQVSGHVDALRTSGVTKLQLPARWP